MRKKHRRSPSSPQQPALCEVDEQASPHDETPAVEPQADETTDRATQVVNHAEDGLDAANSELLRLQRELDEKERLVAALTERLELAAEQLDRLHRTGADRGIAISGGVPLELVERQQQLADELQRAVEQWEDLQLSAALGRIEMQIGELRDLVVSQPVVAAPSDERVTRRRASPDDPTGENGSTGREPSASEDEAPQSSWEALKARLLNGEQGDAAEESPTPTADAEAPATAASESDTPVGEEATPAAIDLASVEPPAEVDFETATLDDLRQAVIQRDAYIDCLLKKVRALQSQPPVDWAALESAPDELRERLEQREKELAECLRLAEVEFSLERARLAREEVRLKQLQEQLARSEREADRFDEAPAEGADAESEQNAGESRWKRLLGLKRSEGTD